MWWISSRSPGRFCLVGNVNDGYSLAPDETPFSKCDVVGNPADDALSAAQRTPLPFANLVGAVRNSSHGTLDVQSSMGDSAVTVAPYPPITPELTAGEWNRAASANNRSRSGCAEGFSVDDCRIFD